MADTKTLLDATLESFLTSQKEWVSHQTMASNTRVIVTLSETGGTYTAPADGWLSVDVTPTSDGNVYAQAQLLGYFNVGAGKRVSFFTAIRKGGSVTVSYPVSTKVNIGFFAYVGQE